MVVDWSTCTREGDRTRRRRLRSAGGGRESQAALLVLEDNAWIVNDTDGEVSAAAAARRRIDQDHILGQANQSLDGFESLEELDANGDGVVSGAELEGVKVWIDANDEGNADETEIKLLAEFQVDALKVKMEVQQNDDGTTQLDGATVTSREPTTASRRSMTARRV